MFIPQIVIISSDSQMTNCIYSTLPVRNFKTISSIISISFFTPLQCQVSVNISTLAVLIGAFRGLLAFREHCFCGAILYTFNIPSLYLINSFRFSHLFRHLWCIHTCKHPGKVDSPVSGWELLSSVKKHYSPPGLHQPSVTSSNHLSNPVFVSSPQCSILFFSKVRSGDITSEILPAWKLSCVAVTNHGGGFLPRRFSMLRPLCCSSWCLCWNELHSLTMLLSILIRTFTSSRCF